MTLPQRISAAAHRDLPHANPLSAAQMNALAAALARRNPRSVLEVGCGPGAFAIELARQCPARITALDINPDFLDRARTALQGQTLRGQVDFRLESTANLGAERFDAVVCMGASQAFGTSRQALARCAALTRPGGAVLFAELTWAAEPPLEFLSFLDCPRDLYWFEDEARAVFEQTGLKIEHQESASRESWQAYEAAVYRGRLAFAEALSGEDAEKMRRSAAVWMDAVERFGQYCLGFSAYLAVKTGE